MNLRFANGQEFFQPGDYTVTKRSIIAVLEMPFTGRSIYKIRQFKINWDDTITPSHPRGNEIDYGEYGTAEYITHHGFPYGPTTNKINQEQYPPEKVEQAMLLASLMEFRI